MAWIYVLFSPFMYVSMSISSALLPVTAVLIRHRSSGCSVVFKGCSVII